VENISIENPITFIYLYSAFGSRYNNRD